MSAHTPKVIAIDGPSASGKSSVSRELAQKLGWKWVSTGAFYRGLAFVAMREGIELGESMGGPNNSAASPATISSLVSLAKSAVWEVRADADLTRVFYKNQDITNEVQAEENGSRASRISQIPEVRKALLQNQRACAENVSGLVAEGRDCGTVVFPQAILKVYLTASQEERAQRRAKEQGLDFAATQSEQIQRDKRDSSRAAAPLQIAPDAKVLDSNGMTLAEVVENVHQWAKEALARSVKSF